MLFNEIYQLLVIDCTSPNDNQVFTVVVSSVKVNNHISVDLSDVIDIPKNWLAHHMLSVNVEVYVFHQSFFWILVDSFQFLPNCVFFYFNVVIVKDRVANHITKYLDCLGNSIRKTCSMVECVLSRCIGI